MKNLQIYHHGGPELWQFISQKKIISKQKQNWTEKYQKIASKLEHYGLPHTSFPLESDEKKKSIIINSM